MIQETTILIERQLTEQIIGAAMKVHSALGRGFLEKVYENALCIELRQRGLIVEQQKTITVYYEEQVVGEYLADVVVQNTILIEIKSVSQVSDAHAAQLRNYLKATKTKVGLVLNFGASSLEWKRMVN
jgi:GxxExxY protein